MSLADDPDDDDLCVAPGGTEEEELSLPRASINKMIKELVIHLFYKFSGTFSFKSSFLGSSHKSCE